MQRDVVVTDLYKALTALDQLAAASNAYEGSLGFAVKQKVAAAIELAEVSGVHPREPKKTS